MIKFVLLLQALNVIFLGSPCASSHTNALFFSESFDSDPFTKWIKSSENKYLDQPLKWTASSHAATGFEKDKGLLLSEEMKYYGVSTKFCDTENGSCKTFDLEKESNKELVIQYELKLDDKLECGGAYIKLLRRSNDNDELDLLKLNNDSPYTIMFGPDKCGGTSKLHFIVQYQNPISKVWEEKHFNDTDIIIRDDQRTHLYTLQINAESNNFEIYVDKKSSKKGNLLTHMTPSIIPPKEIDDPLDKKPTTWVDNPKIEDKSASKPDDWDENAEEFIEDMSVSKPAGWLDEEPADIPDPEHHKPEDWDDQEDGEWESPTIPNPKCEAVGCGDWKRPKIKNPAYKGKWRRPLIDNPSYIGPWSPRKIPNADYFEESHPGRRLAKIEALAVEVWTTNKGIHFDNFVLSHSLSEAFSYAQRTFSAKEKAEEARDREKEQKQSGAGGPLSLENIRAISLQYLKLFESKVKTLSSALQSYTREQPYAVAGALVAMVLGVIYLFIPSAAQTAKSNSDKARAAAASSDKLSVAATATGITAVADSKEDTDSATAAADTHEVDNPSSSGTHTKTSKKK